jgi:hypothetical protein
MSSGSWTNSDGLYLQFGTAKATAEVGGDFLAYGANRVAEVTVNVGTLSSGTATTTTPVSNTLFFPQGQNLFIEKVEVVTEVATSATSGALNIGLVQDDRTTVPTGGASAFVAAATSTAFTTAGTIVTYTAGTASAGGFIGNYNSQWNTNTSGTNSVGGYVTAYVTGTSSATGQLKVRIFYHGVGTITQ